MNGIRIIILPLFFLLPCLLSAQTEAEYAERINAYFLGQREVVVTGGRIDILTDEYAIEVERAKKWKNAIGQSLWYGQQKRCKPGIVIILEEKTEYKYFQMLNSTLQYHKLDTIIQTWYFFEGTLYGIEQ